MIHINSIGPPRPCCEYSERKSSGASISRYETDWVGNWELARLMIGQSKFCTLPGSPLSLPIIKELHITNSHCRFRVVCLSPRFSPQLQGTFAFKSRIQAIDPTAHKTKRMRSLSVVNVVYHLGLYMCNEVRPSGGSNSQLVPHSRGARKPIGPLRM